MNARRTTALTLALAALVAGCGSSSKSTTAAKPKQATTPSTTPSTTTATTATKPKVGFENVPIEQGAQIAPASSTGTGTVDGIKCGATEQLAYHIHAHLAVFVNGQSRSVPGGIGIPGSQVQDSTQGPVAVGGQCIYWLHTHAPDGVIHIESPTHRIYTLGQFFDEWHQPLSATRIGTIQGSLTFLVGGKRWTKDPRLIPLTSHAVVQVDAGQPLAPFEQVNWSETGL